MPLFGATISTYNQKPSTALNSFSTRTFAPTNVAAPKATTVVNTPPAATSPIDTAVKPMTADPTKSAINGSSTMNASGMVSMVQPSVYQPHETGQIGVRNAEGDQGSYNRLNAIDETTNVLNNEMDAKVSAFNNAASAKNSAASQQFGGDLYDGGDNSGLDAEQLQYARQIASVGKSRGMGDDAIQIALMTALTESGLRNLNYGDRDSVGLFQQRTSQGWGSVQQIMDPNYSANKFYDALAKTNYKGATPWQAAQAVQRSFDPTGSNYQKQYALAQRAFQSLTPKQQQQASFGGANSAQGFIQANTNKWIDRDGAYGSQCVDLYNAYTSDFVGGKNIMVGWAPEIFNSYDSNAYTRFGGTQTAGRMGDVAVFNRGGSTPLGHVGIVIGDNGNGTLRMLSANYGTGPSGSMNTTVHNISKSSLMGYLRPKRLM